MPSGSRAALVQLSKESDKGSRSSSATTATSSPASTTSNPASISALTASKHGFAANDELVSDYEKRIAFIQKHHEKLLLALHREMEQLKRKNKG